LRAVATGSTIVPEPLMAAMEARGVPVLCVYGATETGPIAAYDRAGLPRVKGGTGRAGVLSEVAVVDEMGAAVSAGTAGEIAVRGDMFVGYLGDEAASRETIRDGWILTGDIGSLAADGTLTVHDRKKNLIVSGGENVYPAEVERVLAQHPAVAECAVVGRPDPRWQEVPVAFVVLSAPTEPQRLVAHVRAHLAGFKVPRDVRLVDALPRTALGKVRHDALRALAAQELPPVA
jgi:fatty-acyl-CoA synthase